MRNPEARLLSVRNLTTGFDQAGRFVPAVKFEKPQRSWASVQYTLQP